MDNYLKVTEKLYQLRNFLDKNHGDMFERKIFLELKKVEDALGITQCVNCGAYDFIKNLEPTPNEEGGLDLCCTYCSL